MSLSLFRPWGKGYKFDSLFVVKAGRCFDPFMAMPNHSCNPNTFIHFDGRTVRIIAKRELSSREEINISYIAHSNYKIRQLELKSGWGFTCTCHLCVRCKNTMHASAAYFNRILYAVESEPQELAAYTKLSGDLAVDKEVVEIAMWHILLHYRNVWRRHYENGNRKEALKACVKIYCLGQFVRPTATEEEEQDAAYHLIHMLEDQHIELHNDVLDSLRMQLRYVRTEHIACAFGVDSKLAQYERIALGDEIIAWQYKHGKRWITCNRSAVVQRKLSKNLNSLMHWAGIPPYTDADIQAICMTGFDIPT